MAHAQNGVAQLACPACNYGPFTRNNYFTGKLLVERDFTDESRFHMEKLRHHEQLLHGWGVVCGLKVKAAPQRSLPRSFCLRGAGLSSRLLWPRYYRRRRRVRRFYAVPRNQGAQEQQRQGSAHVADLRALP